MRKFFAERRHKKAERLRRMAKRGVLMEDMADFFAGRKTTEESLKWRDFAYKEIDKMSDDEVLS
jgi:hypothetical protein